MNSGFLVLRLVVGLVMAAHGSQKLFGWFGGYGLNGTGGYFEKLGFRPGKLFAFAAGVSEFAGGLLVTLGLLGPVGPALLLATMIVATVTVHWQHGLFATENGVELPLLYSAAAVALALTGFGAFSLDAVLGFAPSTAVSVTVLAIGAIGGIANLLARRQPKASQELKNAA